MSIDPKTLKSRKSSIVSHPPPSNSSSAQPTTFFLKRERDLDQTSQDGENAGVMADSSFGVQSLDEMVAEASQLEDNNTLSRTNSINTDSSVEAGMDASVLAGRKRKARNPVHPTIRTTGQRIISSDALSAQPSSTNSPMSLRSTEASCHINNASQALTPLRLSPRPESALPSTPRSASVRSLRLSDEESSIASDTNSHAIQSSSGDEDCAPSQYEDENPMPQLVMPSLALPARKPFTERGRNMGRLKVMVVGPSGVGKTSLLKSIIRSSEDIVHVDSSSHSTANLLSLPSKDTIPEPTENVTEINASTKPYPSWWSEFDASRSWRRSSTDSILDRNLCFIDTPGSEKSNNAHSIQQYMETLLRRNATMQGMTESEMLHLMTGEGGVLIDAVLVLYDARKPEPSAEADAPHTRLLQEMHRLTNIIPVITHADIASQDQVETLKVEILSTLNKQFSARTVSGEPFAVASALSDDLDNMDASTLMASGYIQPMIPSELPQLLDRLFSDDQMAQLRHKSTRAFLTWRKDNIGNQLDLIKQARLTSPATSNSALDISPSDLPTVTSISSLPRDSGKTLPPHSTSSYHRSASPSAVTDASAASADVAEASAYALAKRNESPSGTEPFRRIRLAKWAQDLQRSLGNERRRFREMYRQRPAEWDAEETSSEKDDLTLVRHNNDVSRKTRPAKGRLGGDLGIIDPRDPLGVLAFGQAFSRQGWFVLRVAGGCGLAGAVAWWVWSSWYEIQDFLGLGTQAGQAVHAPAVAAPPSQTASRGVLEWVDEIGRRLFAW